MPFESVPLATPMATSTPAAQQASAKFWRALPAVLQALTEARTDSPDDVQLATILGAAHLCRFDMRDRHGKDAQEMRADLFASINVSEAAVKLAPDDKMSIAPSIATAASWFLFATDKESGEPAKQHESLLRNSIVYPKFAGIAQGRIAGAMLEWDDPNYSDNKLGYHLMMSTCAGFDLPPSSSLRNLRTPYMGSNRFPRRCATTFPSRLIA